MGEGVNDGGLPRLGCTHYPDSLTAADLERHVPDRLARPRGAFEVGVAEVPQLEDRDISTGLHQPDNEESTAAETAARRSAVLRTSSSSGTPRARRRRARLAARGTSRPTSLSFSTFLKTSAGVPSRTTRPASITTTRSKRVASYMEWVMCKTPISPSRFSSLTVEIRRIATGTGRSEVGSSRIRN